MQVQKLIKKAFEDMLKKKSLSYDLKKDKKESFFFIDVKSKTPSSFKHSIQLEIDIYRKYLVLNIGGWKFFEKTEQNEEIDQLKSIEIMQKFLDNEMKIKVLSKNSHPYSWKAYLFKKYFWEFYRQNSAFLRRFFSFKKPILNEISIELFLNQEKGAA